MKAPSTASWAVAPHVDPYWRENASGRRTAELGPIRLAQLSLGLA